MNLLYVMAGLLFTLNGFAGGMISAEPVTFVAAYECLAKGIDVTHPVPYTRVEFAYEKGDKKKAIETMVAYDKNNKPSYFVGQMDLNAILPQIAGVGFKFDFYRYRNHKEKLGNAIIVGGRGHIHIDKISHLPELILTDCIEK